jgi:hypothetical protein
MTALVWGAAADRIYETGVDRGVLYLPDVTGDYDTGFAWNGLVSVSEAPSGAESNKQYADNGVYLNILSAEEFGGTIEAFAFPKEFMLCDGTAAPKLGVYVGQQTRKPFGLCYRTKVGSALDAGLGYKLHLVYGALASPSERSYTTVNDSPEPLTFSWEFTTTPVTVTGLGATSIITIDSTQVDSGDLAALELLLYGAVATDPTLPTPDEVIALFTDPV